MEIISAFFKKYMNCLWYLQESNQGHMDFQSIALPSELRHLTRVLFKSGAKIRSLK
jgi:hypothetical protein